MPRVTIDDLASRLGLSRAAVSYALNGQPGVSDTTRDRVLGLAVELGWQPSVSARSLSRSRADAVGLVLATPAADVGAEPYYIGLLAGIESAVSQAGVALMLRFVDGVGDADLDVYRRWAAERRVDGVLLVNLHGDDPRPALLDELQLPYFIHGAERGPDGWRSDQGRDARLIVRHVAALGHVRFAHVGGPLSLVHEQERYSAVEAESRAAGITVVHAEGDYSFLGAQRATTDLLAAAVPPTAFVYSSDLMAVGGAALLRHAGQEEATVVSWDDSVLCRASVPGISALERDPYGAGWRSAATLLGQLGVAVDEVADERADALVVRESSRPAPVADRLPANRDRVVTSIT